MTLQFGGNAAHDDEYTAPGHSGPLSVMAGVFGQGGELCANCERLQAENGNLRMAVESWKRDEQITREELAKLSSEIDADNKIIAERDRLLSEIPQCELHGACVPHAIEWVRGMIAENATLKNELADARRRLEVAEDGE